MLKGKEKRCCCDCC